MYICLALIALSLNIHDAFVPATRWIRCLMQQTAELYGDDWHRDTYHNLNLLEENISVPEYFQKPIHGFKNGGGCKYQAMYQSVSMRHIMRIFQQNKNYREETMKFNTKGLEYPSTILDIGCGSGDSTISISELFPLANIFGVDLSPAMIELAKMRTSRSDFYCADATNTPFEDSIADLITSFAMFHEMPADHSQRVILEMKRLIKPTGTILIWDQKITPLSYIQNNPIEPFLESYATLNISQEFGSDFNTIETSEGLFKVWKITKKNELMSGDHALSDALISSGSLIQISG